jgi:hypothetical protein
LDAYLHGVLGGLRVTLKDLVGQKGLGVSSLIFRLELMPTGALESATGASMHVHGQLGVGPQGGGWQHVGPIQTTGAIVFASGPVTTTDFVADVTRNQLERIEDVRADGGAIWLVLSLNGMTFKGGEVTPFAGQLMYEVDAARWIGVLEQCGYGSRVVTHMPSEGPA